MNAARRAHRILSSGRAPLLLSFAGFFLLGSFVFSSGAWRPRALQPIAFNHSKHIAQGLECVNCHTGAADQEHATLPLLDACLMCHESAVTESAEEAKLRALAAAGGELAWTRVTRVPPHVYFSHRRHVQLGKMECQECHGPMETLTEPPVRPFREMTMASCLECHQRKQAGTDCNDCHR